jgi:excisionase family DNA binding protein
VEKYHQLATKRWRLPMRKNESSVQLVSIEKAGEILDESPLTLRRRIKDGVLPSVKIGGRRKIKLADLIALIEQETD